MSEEQWEAEFPDGTYVAGVQPTMLLERRALQLVSKSAKRDPLLAMKESQENMIRLCVRQIGDESVNYQDLRGSGLEKHLGPKQIYMLTELFDSWQTPEQAEVEVFLDSAKMKSATSSTSASTKKAGPMSSRATDEPPVES